MTKEQAIEIIRSEMPKDLKRMHRLQRYEAFELAIENLILNEPRARAEWIPNDYEYHCSQCGYATSDDFIERMRFCPSCGCLMEEEE